MKQKIPTSRNLSTILYTKLLSSQKFFNQRVDAVQIFSIYFILLLVRKLRIRLLRSWIKPKNRKRIAGRIVKGGWVGKKEMSISSFLKENPTYCANTECLSKVACTFSAGLSNFSLPVIIDFLICRFARPIDSPYMYTRLLFIGKKINRQSFINCKDILVKQTTVFLGLVSRVFLSGHKWLLDRRSSRKICQ